jgi:hypothetical protein
MVCRSSRRALALFIFVACSMAICSVSAFAQPDDDFDILNEQVLRLYGAGKYSQALEIATRALTVAERQFGHSYGLRWALSTTFFHFSFSA